MTPISSRICTPGMCRPCRRAPSVVWESQAKLRQWNGTDIHWRSDNDVVASNGIIINELRPYLIEN